MLLHHIAMLGNLIGSQETAAFIIFQKTPGQINIPILTNYLMHTFIFIGITGRIHAFPAIPIKFEAVIRNHILGRSAYFAPFGAIAYDLGIQGFFGRYPPINGFH